MTKKTRIALFYEYMSHIFEDNEIKEMTGKLDGMRFFEAPASTKYHGNYKGGLFDHSANVTNALVNLTIREGLNWERPQSPYIIGMFHDLCKCDQYKLLQGRYEDGKATTEYNEWEYATDTILKGHGDKSVMLASTLTQLTLEEVCCIRYHMGAFTDKEEWNYYTRAIHKYPNVLYTHTADMIAAHIKEIDNG